MPRNVVVAILGADQELLRKDTAFGRSLAGAIERALVDSSSLPLHVDTDSASSALLLAAECPEAACLAVVGGQSAKVLALLQDTPVGETQKILSAAAATEGLAVRKRPSPRKPNDTADGPEGADDEKRRGRKKKADEAPDEEPGALGPTFETGMRREHYPGDHSESEGYQGARSSRGDQSEEIGYGAPVTATETNEQKTARAEFLETIRAIDPKYVKLQEQKHGYNLPEICRKIAMRCWLKHLPDSSATEALRREIESLEQNEIFTWQG